MLIRSITMFVCLAFAVSAAFADAVPPEGFTVLFNANDLSGWHGRPHFDPRKLAAMNDQQRRQTLDGWRQETVEHWRVENGELVNGGKGPYLTTDSEFADFELLIEYKTVAKADSGIYLRGNPQVQIWDFTRAGGKWNRAADKGSGGLFNNARRAPGQEPLVLADKPFGEWNVFRIRQVGARTDVWLNDRLVVDNAPMENYWNRSRPQFRTGPIQLQTHGGEIRWRNIFIREVPADEANKILRTGEGFKTIFNGRDFTGWQGDVDSYEVKHGAIVCKPGQSGNLFTVDEFSDFIARLEFKLPSGGNNGLVIRYPGTGQPHLMGMCELQVLDNTHLNFAKLDPRQFHGSAYGMVAAHRGFLRPAGQWNFQEVAVRGSRVTVELNGFPILDADLSKVTEFKDGTSHPGKDRLTGFFGFAGHNDPVAFRKIGIKRLDPAETQIAQTWPQFRGHNSSGLAATREPLPDQIGPDVNVAWKISMPPGHSSPVVFEDRIYLTAVRDEKLVTIALERETGEMLWERVARHSTFEKIHQIGSYAQCSPVTDGKIVASLFGSTGLFCYNRDGNELWTLPMGPFNNDFGAGTSPVIIDDRIIIVQDHDADSFLMAVDKKTGRPIWKTDRSEFPRNYCSPVIWEVAGRKQVIVAATLRVVGYDLETGKELWTVRGFSRAVCVTPVVGEDNILYVAGWARGGDLDERISVEPFAKLAAARDKNNNGTLERTELEKGHAIERRFPQVDRDKTGTITRSEYEYYRNLFDVARNVVLAIKPGASGDATRTHVAWEYRRHIPFCASPLFFNKTLFTVKDGGILTSLDARSGKPLLTKRVPGAGNYYSSPVAGDGKVYLLDQKGRLSVISGEGKWKVLHRAQFGEETYATPALVDGRIYLRTNGHLYCFK